MCSACYQRWRRSDPEEAHRSLEAARAWKRRNPERVKAYDARYIAEVKMDDCKCGGRKMATSRQCANCRAEAAEFRRTAIVEMYQAGTPIREIAEVMGTTRESMGVETVRLRKIGLIGYRHTAYEQRDT